MSEIIANFSTLNNYKNLKLGKDTAINEVADCIKNQLGIFKKKPQDPKVNRLFQKIRILATLKLQMDKFYAKWGSVVNHQRLKDEKCILITAITNAIAKKLFSLAIVLIMKIEDSVMRQGEIIFLVQNMENQKDTITSTKYQILLQTILNLVDSDLKEFLQSVQIAKKLQA